MIQLLAVTIMPKHCAEFRTNHSQSLSNEISAIFEGDMMHYRPPIRHFLWGMSPCPPRDLRHWASEHRQPWSSMQHTIIHRRRQNVLCTM